MATSARTGVISRPLFRGRMSPEPDADVGVDLKQLKEELTCSICLEICIRPCSTPCGHSFCRRCLRDAMRYSPKCPKCREVLPSGSMNVNSTLWNTIRMLFPKTNEAPPSPPSPSPIRQATDRRHRQILTAREAEMLRRIELDRASRDRTQSPQSQSRTLHSGESYSSHRRRRMSPLRQVSHVARNVATATLRGQPVSLAMTRAHRAADSAGGSQSRSHISQDDQISRPSRHGIVGSSRNHSPRTPINASPDSLATHEPTHHEDNTVHETLSSSEFPWIQTLNGQRRAASGIRNGHGIGVASSLNRSASHGDIQNDVEYVTIQRVQRLDQVPLHLRQGVYRLENIHRNRILRRHNGNQYVAPVEDVPDDSIEPPMDPEFEEDDFETASDIISDRDSSFTSSIATPFAGSRANSFRFHEDGTTSPVSISAAQNDQPESVVDSFGGYERLYDISSQIEAAMDQIERLSMQPGWSRPTEASQPPVTPLTHRSCFQLSDDEEDDDEDLEWNSRVRDAVFIVDGLETDSDTDSDAASESFSPYDDVDAAMRPMTDAARIRSVEESYYY